jgi:threonine synthase
MLRALRESDGGVVAVTDARLVEEAETGTRESGIDYAPEGGAALAGACELLARGGIQPDERVVVFNTGAGWLYREPGGLPLT